MRLALFVQQAMHNRLYGGEPVLTGIGYYIVRLVRSLAAIDRDNEYCLFYISSEDQEGPLRELMHLDQNSSFTLQRIPHEPSRIYGLWHMLGSPKLERFIGEVDLVHLPTVAVRVPTKAPCVATVHDLTFLQFPHSYSWRRRLFARRALQTVLDAKCHVIADSQAVATDLQNYGFPESCIRVIPLGPSYEAQGVSTEAMQRTLDRYGVSRPYFLFVGALTPRKNLPNLLKAFGQLPSPVRSTYQLVLAGPPADDAKVVERTIDELGLRERVNLTGYVSEEELHALHCGASVFVMPSMGEGFGIPVLDSMLCGVPVAASRAGSLPEILQGAGLLFDPQDIGDIRDALARQAQDQPLRDQLTERGRGRACEFGWDKTARGVLQVYREVAHA